MKLPREKIRRAQTLATGVLVKRALTLAFLAGLAVFIWWGDAHLDRLMWRIINLGAIYSIAAVGYTLVNGWAGQFSLGPHGFMLLGGYLTALLVLPPTVKRTLWILQPLIEPFASFHLPKSGFVLALVAGGVLAALASLIIGIPALRALRGDYLAIATLGFGEILFLLVVNLPFLTNGAMGITRIPTYANLAWSCGTLVLVSYAAIRLKNSSYGRAMRAIREDELAAEAMGINVFRLKLLAFLFSAFCAGVSGGLLVTLLSTAHPSLFTFVTTFYFLLIIVLGGMGSVSGAIVGGFIFAAIFEVLRFADTAVVPGMRMVIFSVLLILAMLFFRRGLFGLREFSWEGAWQGVRAAWRWAWTKIT